METLPRQTATHHGRLLPVVVGYDGTRPARRALSWAATEAERRGTRLAVLYAANYPGMATRLPGEALAPGAVATATAVTDEGVDAVRADHPGLDVSGRTELTSGADALLEASAAAALVVVGTGARPRVVKALIGSVAYAVSARSACPVVVVKEGENGIEPAGPGRAVVVGSDGSAHADAAVTFAAEHALTTAAPLEVLCCDNPDFSATVTEDELRAERGAVAERVAAELARSYPSLDAVVRDPDGPAQQVLTDASRDAALVVVGSRGRGALSGLVLGSVSQAVIHDARCPVAVVSSASDLGPHGRDQQGP